MAIIETEVWVGLGKNSEYYQSKGYDIPTYIDNRGKTKIKQGTKILVRVEDLFPKGGTKVTKACDDCGVIIENQQYVSIITSRNNGDGKDRCLKCSRIRSGINKRNTIPFKRSLEYFVKENNLEYLLDEFSKKNIKRPKDISHGTKDKYLWNCPDCKSEYSMSVGNRAYHKCKCVYCTGVKVNVTNSFATICPEIATEWHPKLNFKTPYDYTSSSGRKVWWLCSKCENSYASTMADRKNGYGCPYCSNTKVYLGNCLATICPEVAREWHLRKNGALTPFDVIKSTNKKVWWHCEDGHEWEATVGSRTFYKGGCPQCKESRGEKLVRYILNNYDIAFLTQYEFDDLRGRKGHLLKYDFSIKNEEKCVKLIIEYDGEFHFRKIHKGNGHEDTVEHDKRKNQYCIDNNIPLIRIPYWEFDNIERILENVLKHYNLIDSDNTYEKDKVLRYLVDGNWSQDEYIKSAKTK